ncbi:Retrovirus-related Pol polyprotein from transposon TNT 1-94 [Eumeta japonica]|uniref:Retrovirus-related Pol polyprotein from transposon TNT 1-94 n=1 Tax=Eumeta variegata TaxID=151549 RepID=A0A4C1SGV2_EUMVA|nr:Retrovirus-related Pol polyprotein from transposon TNT 1-94 [Eumeta japonica]
MDSTQGGSGQQNVMKLEGSRNWNVWKFQTSVLLRGQGLYKIVDGTTVKPEDDTQRSTWETQDARAQTLIVTRMTEEVMLHIISCDTAAAMWRDVCVLSKVHEMQNQLKQLGENMSDKFVITKVLMSLPEDYKHFISAWESAPDDKQTYDNLVARLLIEEERIKEKAGQRRLRLGNGTKINVKGCGQVALQVWNGSEWIDTTIDNVLHVPELKTNLFSVNCATSRGYVIVTEENKCKFYKQNKVMAIAERRGSMYYLDFRYFNAYTANLADVCCDLREWHEKLVHQNIVYVKDVLKKNNINIKNANVQTCESCLKGKIHRLPYPVSNNVTSRVCEIIHADTCGPMEKPSIGGSRYFVVFKDEYSKYRRVFFVKTKDEIKSCIKNFISQAENETGNKIKIFRSDNGTEFINKEVREVFQNKGIIHQTSVTFTPEQNGVAERENRILVEAARTMLYAKDLPISLWAESVNTAAYVINRTGKSSIEGKSPYELWSSKSYDINNLKIFGTTVYVHIPKEKRHKWDAKGEKGIMVGYGETIKGYRVYFPQKSEVETKRDIVFVNNSPVKPIQQCETINYIEDSVEVPATVEVGAQVEDTSAAGMSSPQSPTMDGDDSQHHAE